MAAHDAVELVVAAHDTVKLVVAVHDAVELVVAVHDAVELVAAHDATKAAVVSQSLSLSHCVTFHFLFQPNTAVYTKIMQFK